MLIKNAMIITMDKNKTFYKKGDILIKGNKIVKVGNFEEDDEIIDATGMVALPGFINTHNHSPMSLLRGYADDLPLMEWLTKYIWPLEAKLNENDCYIGSKLACLEMIKAGITTFADMYFYMKGVAKAVKESGIRGVLSEGIIDDLPIGKFENSVKFLKEIKKDDNIIPAVSPHSPYSCSEETLMKAKKLANEFNTIIQIHVSETKQEVEKILKEKGKRPIEYLDSIGFLDKNVLIAHCVWPSPKELEILVGKGVKISHCPVSNKKISSGIAPIKLMVENGLIVSLGTDGPCANNRLDMIQEMKFASLLQKVYTRDPTSIPAKKALEMATINGARALGLDDRLGSIEVGKIADIILIDLKKSHLTPLHNVFSHLVYAAQASDIDTVICNGKLVMRNRKVLTIDENEVMKKAEEVKTDLLSRP